MRRRAATSLLAVGLVSMLAQVVLLRELLVASFGIELAVLVGTALWLAAGALGAVAPPLRDPGRQLAAGFLSVALLLLAEVAFLRGARLLLGGVRGAYLPLGEQLAVAAAGLAPAGAVLGWLFRAGARAFARARGSLADAYGLECLGAAIGCGLTTVALVAGVPSAALAAVASLASACAAAAAFPAWRRGALVVALALLAPLGAAGPLDRFMTGWNHPELAAAVDTPYGRVAISTSDGLVTVFQDDALVWDSEGTEAELLVHPAALQVGPGARVLVLEGGAFGLVEAVLEHHPARVDVVALDADLVRVLEPHLPSAGRQALAAPAVRSVQADPRAFVASRAGPYDLVVIGAGEPSSGQGNRLYTVEFFRACAAVLAPGGTLALRLPSSENLWTPGLVRRNGAVYAALRAAFRDVLVLPGGTDVLLASQAPLVRDPAVLGERLRSRGVRAREVTPRLLRYLLTNDRVDAVAALLAAAGAEPNTDERPACYQQTALLWLGRLAGDARDVRLPGRPAALGVAGLLAVLVVASRRWPRARRAATVAAAALVGMAIESVVLLRYQAAAGALFRDLGALLTAFMVGLAAGARWVGARAGGPAPPGRSWRVVPMLALAVVSLLVAVAPRAVAASGLAASLAVLAAAGALVAVVFGVASHAAPSGAAPTAGGEDAGVLYAADLVGGCLGSLLAGGLFVAVLGLDGTALVAALLAIVAMAVAA